MTSQESGQAEPIARRELADRFAELLDAISLGLRLPILEAWAEIELTMHQFRTLALLRQAPQRVSDIAARLGIRLSAATSFVDRLETKRLVERVHDTTDRRVVRCQLTPLGRKEADSLWRINREWLENLSKNMTAEELHTIVHAFGIVSAAIDRQNPTGGGRDPR